MIWTFHLASPKAIKKTQQLVRPWQTNRLQGLGKEDLELSFDQKHLEIWIDLLVITFEIIEFIFAAKIKLQVPKN